jgi:hypothetical protein
MPSHYTVLLGALVGFSSLGCMRASIDRAADARVAEVRDQTESAIVFTSCPDNRPLAASCGLILPHYASDDFRTTFRDSFCKELSPEACQSRYERMINARLEERYYAADRDATTRTCDANPGRCDDPVAYERLLLDSHNARVRQEGARAELLAEKRRRHAHAADVQATLATAAMVTGEIAYDVHAGPKCRTYPGLLGGMNTVCSDGRR